MLLAAFIAAMSWSLAVGVVAAAVPSSTVPPSTAVATTSTVVPSTTGPTGPTTSLTGVTGSAPGSQQSTTAKDPAQARLRWIIIGFFVLAAIILAGTVIFWWRTRPLAEQTETIEPSEPIDPTGLAAAPTSKGDAAPALIIPPVVVPESLRHVPMWSEDDPADR